MMDMKKMMREAQRMQEKLQQELSAMRVSASAGGGVVTATVNGSKELIELKLAPEAVDPSDVEMLQDLVVAAVGEAQRRVDEAVQQKLGSMLPGGLGGLGGMFA